MKPVRAVFLTLLTLSGMVVGVSLAAGVTTSSATTSASTDQVESASPTNPLGSQISAFMQSNAAEASSAVELGMWTATFDHTENESTKAALVTSHVDALQNRLDDIQKRKQTLIEKRKAGEISRLKYESEMSALVGRYVVLMKSINATEKRAEETGVNTSELAELRANSKEVAGPKVSAVAHNLTGVDAPGLEKRPDHPAATAGNGRSEGKSNAGNAKAADHGKVNASVNVNGSVANASTTVNVTTNATGSPANATVTPSNGNGGPDVGADPGNGQSNRSNRSDVNRNPATEESTRLVTTTVGVITGESAEPSTTGAENETGMETTGGGNHTITTETGTTPTVAPTTAFAAE